MLSALFMSRACIILQNFRRQINLGKTVLGGNRLVEKKLGLAGCLKHVHNQAMHSVHSLLLAVRLFLNAV